MLKVAKFTQKNYRKLAALENVPILLTIPYSHFVEFSRFSLQLGGVKFREVGYAPGQHVLPVLNLR